MEIAEHIDAVRDQGERRADAAGRARLDAPVAPPPAPAAPTRAHLLVHFSPAPSPAAVARRRNHTDVTAELF